MRDEGGMRGVRGIEVRGGGRENQSVGCLVYIVGGTRQSWHHDTAVCWLWLDKSRIPHATSDNQRSPLVPWRLPTPCPSSVPTTPILCSRSPLPEDIPLPSYFICSNHTHSCRRSLDLVFGEFAIFCCLLNSNLFCHSCSHRPATHVMAFSLYSPPTSLSVPSCPLPHC